MRLGQKLREELPSVDKREGEENGDRMGSMVCPEFRGVWIIEEEDKMNQGKECPNMTHKRDNQEGHGWEMPSGSHALQVTLVQ